MSNNQNKKTIEFVVKEFQEVKGGWYDDYGFYYTPNGSFWDEEGYYFNKEGKDNHGGCYDDNLNYIPGVGWDKNKECYLSELDGEDDFDHFEDDGGYDEDDLANDLECAELDDYEHFIKGSLNKIVPSSQTEKQEAKQSDKVDTIEKIGEKNVQIEEKTVKVEPRKNKLNDLFSNTSDKTGKINKVVPKK